MIHPSKLAMTRLWLTGHNAFVVMASITLMLAIGTGTILFPVGPNVHVVGTVVRISYWGNKYGRYPVAYVDADGREAVVAPLFDRSCAVGSLIGLERQRRIWGYSFAADAPACGR